MSNQKVKRDEILNKANKELGLAKNRIAKLEATLLDIKVVFPIGGRDNIRNTVLHKRIDVALREDSKDGGTL